MDKDSLLISASKQYAAEGRYTLAHLCLLSVANNFCTHVGDEVIDKIAAKQNAADKAKSMDSSAL